MLEWTRLMCLCLCWWSICPASFTGEKTLSRCSCSKDESWVSYALPGAPASEHLGLIPQILCPYLLICCWYVKLVMLIVSVLPDPHLAISWNRWGSCFAPTFIAFCTPNLNAYIWLFGHSKLKEKVSPDCAKWSIIAIIAPFEADCLEVRGRP